MEVMLFVSIAYAFVFLLLTVSLFFPERKPGKPLIGRLSVCIPFRNEITNLETNCLSVKALDDEQVDVIYADDHSDDGSAQICVDHGFTVVAVENGNGKTAALRTASLEAKNDLLVFTDADCSVPPSWLWEFRHHFSEDICLYIGTIAVRRSPIMTLDFNCLIGAAAALYRLGIPSSCPGANIAVTKEVFLRFTAYSPNQHAADDAALFHYIHTVEKKRIRFIFSPFHTVTTEPYDSLGAFFSQRLRWVKGGYRLDPLLFTYLSFILCTHFLFFIFPMWLWVPVLCSLVFSAATAIKMRQYRLLPLTPLYGIFFTAYTTLTGILFPFMGRCVRWKGRAL